MASPRSETELLVIRRLAGDLARQRKERPSTGHLLAAIASCAGPAQRLLSERRLEADMLLKSARVTTDDAPDAFELTVQRARDFACRGAMREAGAVHLLFALCQDRTTASHRLITQCGIDVNKLRSHAMQIALGVVEPPRAPVHQTAQKPRSAPPQPRPATPAQAKPPVAKTTPAPTHAPPRRTVEPAARHRRKEVVSAHTTTLATTALDPQQVPLLAAVGKPVSLGAPVIGRHREMDQLEDILARQHAPNAVLIGEPGVGKTSIVAGLAKRYAGRQAPLLIEVDAAALIAGSGVRGAVSEKLVQLRAEVAKLGGQSAVILFFEDVAALMSPDPGDEAAAELRSALQVADLRVILAASPDNYRRVIEPQLGRWLTAIEVSELPKEEVLLALQDLTKALHAHHGTSIDDSVIEAAIVMSDRYISDRAMPEKALSVLDLAGARAKRQGDAAVLREHVAHVVATRSGVPVERLLETDGDRMLRMEALLAERVVGHEAELHQIARVLRRNASGFRSQRPIGTFLLLGSTGVGKTETAKAVASALFFSPTAMTRLDMSEFAEAHAVARLIGAPPGYIGHEAGGQLTEAVRKRPYQVLLLDEIEKAHLDVLEAFLQVFDEGRLTDGRGRTVDFTNTVIVLTSNVGARELLGEASSRAIGFGADEKRKRTHDAVLTEAARALLPPELYNRIDEVLAFAPLTRDDVSRIAERMLAQLARDLLRVRGVSITFDAGVIDHLLDHGGFDPELGARPMRRAIGRLIEGPLAELLLNGEAAQADDVTAAIEGDRLVIHRARRRRLAPKESRAS
jgi:ATP-dependent Clp protease ATP-binding subunit ClpC